MEVGLSKILSSNRGNPSVATSFIVSGILCLPACRQSPFYPSSHNNETPLHRAGSGARRVGQWARERLLRGLLVVTTTGLHLHRTTYGAVQVAPVSRRQPTACPDGQSRGRTSVLLCNVPYATLAQLNQVSGTSINNPMSHAPAVPGSTRRGRASIVA
jgi:hypothetical protein